MSAVAGAPGVVDPGALTALRASLAASGFTVTGELALPARSVEDAEATSAIRGPSVRLDVAEDRDAEDRVVTAVRLYTGSASSVVLHTGELALLARTDHPSDAGSSLRTLVDDEREEWSDPHSSYRLSDLAVPSNADVERLLALAARTELAPVVNEPESAWAWRTARVDGLPEGAVSALGEVARVVGLEDDVTLVGFALAERVLTDLASGVPLEWALHHAAGSAS